MTEKRYKVETSCVSLENLTDKNYSLQDHSDVCKIIRK